MPVSPSDTTLTPPSQVSRCTPRPRPLSAHSGVPPAQTAATPAQSLMQTSSTTPCPPSTTPPSAVGPSPPRRPPPPERMPLLERRRWHATSAEACFYIYFLSGIDNTELQGASCAATAQGPHVRTAPRARSSASMSPPRSAEGQARPPREAAPRRPSTPCAWILQALLIMPQRLIVHLAPCSQRTSSPPKPPRCTPTLTSCPSTRSTFFLSSPLPLPRAICPTQTSSAASTTRAHGVPGDGKQAQKTGRVLKGNE